MNNSKLGELVQKIAEQMTLDGIKTKDLVEEMQNAYTTLESNRKELDDNEKEIEKLKDEVLDQGNLIKNYEDKYVNKAKIFKADKKAFDKEKLIFDLEKEYIKRENGFLREIVQSMLAMRQTTYSVYGQNGANLSYREDVTKPNLKDLTDKFNEQNK